MELTLIATKEQEQATTSGSSPAIAHPPGQVLEFGRFRVLLPQRRLLADGVPIELGSRAFDILLTLIEADGSLVTKDELLSRVWPRIVVAPDNLKVQVAALRKALGGGRDFIRTEFGRGYRFTAAVRRSSVNDQEPLPETEGVGAPAVSNAALPTQLAAMNAQLACLEGKLAQALQLLNERAQREAEPFHRHIHWTSFSDGTNRRSLREGAEARKMTSFPRRA